ncbi:hypothetical protein J7J47_03695 [Halomonas sp. ISL-60]|uniref:hypothetical protein n=1 Tax=Halomonas sp. ISL-56 TaxID=2819149 RepID=UPI001BE89D30|nr:hypothetical protein [Halomonas sp. ISL-56]MBT2771333.1 hypothetical protein [Halomonas sp. ISL-60]MBT2800690.1 hypothetical protein [Halomonas sp. ISL-56]
MKNENKKTIHITVERKELDRVGDIAREHNMTITDVINLYMQKTTSEMVGKLLDE